MKFIKLWAFYTDPEDEFITYLNVGTISAIDDDEYKGELITEITIGDGIIRTHEAADHLAQRINNGRYMDFEEDDK